jgi:hypothetical protein
MGGYVPPQRIPTLMNKIKAEYALYLKTERSELAKIKETKKAADLPETFDSKIIFGEQKEKLQELETGYKQNVEKLIEKELIPNLKSTVKQQLGKVLCITGAVYFLAESIAAIINIIDWSVGPAIVNLALVAIFGAVATGGAILYWSNDRKEQVFDMLHIVTETTDKKIRAWQERGMHWTLNPALHLKTNRKTN